MNQSTRQVETGMYAYEADTEWAKLPPHLEFGYTHGIVVDQADNVYVFHTGIPSVFQFDAEGNFLRS